MSERSEHELDELLGRHLGACLDGQLGRATAAFRAAERAERRTAAAARWRWWAGGAVGVAAGVAIAWMMFANRLPHGSISKPDLVTDMSTAAVPPMVQSTTWSPVKDDGLAVVDDQPVRQWRRQIVEEVEWYDAKDGAMVRTRMPRQQIILIGLRAD